MLNHNKKIHVSGPDITEKEIAYVTEAVKSAWYDNSNFYNNKFENDFKHYVGREYAIALPSCTSAIHLALLALGIGLDDEVIVPDITWIATSAPISYVGAKAVFADVDPNTWCISPESIENRITKNTKAIIAVDLYGNICSMERILEIANRHGLSVIEDAAQAMGSEYMGRKAGSFGEVSVFSFHGSKVMTTGEGGMLVTDDEKIYKRCLKLRDHGRAESSKMFWNDEIGFKYKMSSMQAALGIAQLERIEELVQKKRSIFDWYKSELGNVKGLSLNAEPEGTRNNYWMVTIAWDSDIYSISKEQFIEKMKAHGIDTRPFFYPLSSVPAYKETVKGMSYSAINLVSYRISPYAVNLPCGMNMNQEMAKYVCSCVKEHLSLD